MKNSSGTVKRVNLEWGGKARKEEDHLRGFRRRGRVESIADSSDEADEEPPD